MARFDFQPRGHLVSAEGNQMSRAHDSRARPDGIRESIGHALTLAVAQGDHDGWPAKTIDDTRSDNADDPRVPAFGGQHRRAMSILGPSVGFDLGQGLVEDLSFHGLAGAVLRFKINRDLPGAVSPAVVSISTARAAWPSRPQAFNRGASRNPTS